jgi:hypothetical protein
MNTADPFDDQWGKLGNQLFQLGLLYALRQSRGHEFYLPRDGQIVWGGFDLEVPAIGPPCPYRFEESHGSCNFDPDVFEQPDGTAFRGYFQSYRYMDDCRRELRQWLRFRFPYRALSEAVLYAYRRRYGRPLAAVHVRRGDYLVPQTEPEWGNLARDGYYERAAQMIGRDVTYVVFSDDLDWCRDSLALDPMVFADFDHYTCLCLMAGCDVNVVANSSFSWWGAYLNPGSEVYAPSRWWRDMPAPNDRQDDIVPPGWQTVPTFEQPASLPASLPAGQAS